MIKALKNTMFLQRRSCINRRTDPQTKQPQAAGQSPAHRHSNVHNREKKKKKKKKNSTEKKTRRGASVGDPRATSQKKQERGERKDESYVDMTHE